MNLLAKWSAWRFPKKVHHPRLRTPEYIGRHAGRTALVLGTGPSIRAERQSILSFINGHDPIILGAQHSFPEYALHYVGFSNRRRFLTYAAAIAKHTCLLIAPYIPQWVVRGVLDQPWGASWEPMPFVNDNEAPFAVDHGIIQSGCGQTGCLLLGVAYVMGCTRIFAAGLDGYTDPTNWHAYGGTEGRSEANFTKCVELSKIVAKRLAEMRTVFAANGVEGPSIITKTAYEDFYAPQ